MKVTYQFASIWRRCLAGIGDYLTMWVVSFSTLFLFLIGKDIPKIFNDSSYTIEGWRFFGYTIVNFCLYFGYFILVPYLTKGFTTWTKIAKIKMINNKNNHLSIREICLHNLILWMLMMGWLVCVGIMFWIFDSFGEQKSFLESLFSFSFSNSSSSGVGFGIGLFAKIVTIIIGIITGVFLINIIVNRSTYALVDSMSDTYMIFDKNIEEIDKKTILNETIVTNKELKNIPGIFDQQEEINLTNNPLNNKNKEKNNG